MMHRKSLRRLTVAGAVLAVIGAVSAASPALAQAASGQSSVEELTVTGRYGAVPDNVKSLSLPVSYADLDLSTDAGKHEFRHRISLTARYLCDKLGEPDTTSNGIVPSCRDDAERNANAQAETVLAHFSPRGPTWTVGPAWSAPYPATWAEKYP
jgi:UrcA family protein